MPENTWDRLKRARIVRVLLVYFGAAWGVLEVADLLQDSLSLPDWVVPVALLLLLIGLVVIVSTAFVQATPGTEQKQDAGELPGAWEVDPKDIAESLKKGKLPHLTWGRSILGGVFAFWFLFGLAGLYVVIKDRGESFAPVPAVAGEAAEGIAVVPFTVRGEEFVMFREGMVDLLSTNLDDVGGYRTIDSRTVLARWDEAVAEGEIADLATRLEVARAAGARYVIDGTVMAIGDGVRLAADVYDVESGREVGSGQVEGPADSIGSLASRLGVQTLQALLAEDGGEGVTARAAMSLTTASLPALKAYLEGEAYYRQADFDRAIEAYERALVEDPEMALAHFRLGDAYGWAENIGSDRGMEHLAEAQRLGDRLSNRDRAIMDGTMALLVGDISAVDDVREVTRRYPDDPDAWFLLSEFYFHYWSDLQLDWEDLGRVFERPVELEPSFAPYYIHMFEYAVIHRDTAAARRALEGLRPLNARRQEALELVHGLVLGDSTRQAEAAAAVPDLRDDVLEDAYIDLWLTAGRPVAMEPIFLELQRRRHPAGGNLAWLYLTAGKADAALSATPDGGWTSMWIPYAVDRTLEPLPSDYLEQILQRDNCGPAAEAPIHCLITLGAYYAEQGKEEQLETLLDDMRSGAAEAAAEGRERSAEMLTLAADALDAYGWAKNGDRVEPGGAIQKLEDLAFTGLPPSIWVRWWLGELHLEDGQPGDAVVYLESLRGSGVPHVANFLLGRAYTELGEREKARAAYVRFVQAWEEADADLPQLQEARAALEELLAG
ncbi:MAG: tetratricopeptide repeat protein [Gemmatimonadetes bacterium]|nr:tetratricopeptide repeat protein [Gemmatimonadota bacterium]